jgi:hypothetical protein
MKTAKSNSTLVSFLLMEMNLDVDRKESDEKFGSSKSQTYYSTLMLYGNRKAGLSRLTFYLVKSFAAVGTNMVLLMGYSERSSVVLTKAR